MTIDNKISLSVGILRECFRWPSRRLRLRLLKNTSISTAMALMLVTVAPLFPQDRMKLPPGAVLEMPAPKSSEARPLATRDILKLDGPSVLEIEVHDKSGAASAQASGVVIALNGVVATNAHVLAGACNLYIKEQSGSLVAASTLLNIDADKDIAILLFPKSFPVAKLGTSRALQVGDRVVTIGNPLGLEQSVSEGIVSGFRRMDGERSVIQTTAPISPGSSGGGLFNGRGELIGLTTFTLQGSQSLNFAVPLSDVMGLLRSGAQVVTPENLFQWAKVTYPNCSGSTSSLDSMVIMQQVLGRELRDHQFMEVLKQLNGGREATPYQVNIYKGMGEFRNYSFPIHVGVQVINGICDNVNFFPGFGGIPPLGLSWDKSRPEVQRLIGVPSFSSGSPDGNEIIDNYDNLGQYRYDITYQNGKLASISARH